MAKHEGSSTLRYVGIWVALAVLTVATWILGEKVHLGALALPVSLAIAIAKTVLVAVFFMHLVEQPGARRLVFPVSVAFLTLLLGVTLLEAMTRFPPVQKGTIDWELEPLRPAPTRTTPADPLTEPPPHRPPGQ